MGVLAFLCLLTGLLGGNALFGDEVSDPGPESYRLINPTIKPDDPQSGRNPHFRSFKYKVVELVDEKLALKDVLHISVYYRDLNNGPSFGINATEDFVPASLLKVPLMMAYFKQAETRPEILSEKVRYEGPTKKYDIEQYIVPVESLKKGRSYTREDLIRRMISYSDNEAAFLLYRKSYLDRVFEDLGMLTPGARTPRGMISVREYASFFRVLYNASYLNAPMSEKALGHLSQTNFKRGLAAEVPREVPVAHKFGESDHKGDKQLHDCGIVYYPGRPYLLCVMTRGDDFSQLEGIIQALSALMYDEVGQQMRSSQPPRP